MSGTAALAAARRRRAGGGATVNTYAPESSEIKPPKVIINPLEILKKHENQIISINHYINSTKNTPVTNNDIQFYKDKYTNLLSEMTEMKTNFVKVQTFCMETNNKLDEMNKQINKMNLEVND